MVLTETELEWLQEKKQELLIALYILPRSGVRRFGDDRGQLLDWDELIAVFQY